jgi:ammonia channel protein AmtB
MAQMQEVPMETHTVIWPVFPIAGLILVSVLVLALGYWPRRRTGSLPTRIMLVFTSMSLLAVAFFFWGYYVFYGGD